MHAFSPSGIQNQRGGKHHNMPPAIEQRLMLGCVVLEDVHERPIAAEDFVSVAFRLPRVVMLSGYYLNSCAVSLGGELPPPACRCFSLFHPRIQRYWQY